MLILGIDTATPRGTVALNEDGENIFEFGFKAGKGGGEYVISLLKPFFSRAGRDFSQLGLVAAGTGPGSYTGIRVGLATVAGLTEGLRIPVYGVNTLRIIAENARNVAEWVAVALDARRTEVYAALYHWEDDDLREMLSPRAIPAGDFAASLGELPSVIICGDGSKKYRDIWLAAHPLITIGPERWDYPLAGLAIEIARRKWRPGLSDASALTPSYLKRVEAEIRLEEKLREDQCDANVCRGFGRGSGD
jgi:tRNA threonylcarbamoyladenosine biosynthesis protein TsaB